MKNKEAILEIIKNLDGSKVAIWISSPDPDALGSAMGLQWLLSKNNITSDIWFKGLISHAQNKTMVNILNITLLNLDNDDYVNIYEEKALVL